MIVPTEDEKRRERQQYYPGDIVWKIHSKDVTPEQKAATLKDQADRKKAARVSMVKKAVTKRLGKGE